MQIEKGEREMNEYMVLLDDGEEIIVYAESFSGAMNEARVFGYKPVKAELA